MIFRSGEGALQVLPQLLGVVPEARLNLALYYLRQGELLPPQVVKFGQIHSVCVCVCVCVCVDNVEDAYALIRDLEPGSPQEYILKAVANTVIGQEQGSVSSLTHTEATVCYFIFVCPQHENLKLAQQYFQLVGSSGSECGKAWDRWWRSVVLICPCSCRHHSWSAVHGVMLLSTAAV